MPISFRTAAAAALAAPTHPAFLSREMGYPKVARYKCPHSLLRNPFVFCRDFARDAAEGDILIVGDGKPENAFNIRPWEKGRKKERKEGRKDGEGRGTSSGSKELHFSPLLFI